LDKKSAKRTARDVVFSFHHTCRPIAIEELRHGENLGRILTKSSKPFATPPTTMLQTLLLPTCGT
jgi:hypothetical protein